ncbi:MAG: CDP-alcohol phosphatidyltransferase family protein [Polyangiaceae bacterium]|nr:CDP-alcohol phosphatidyltransferase family protein [Polyangiaceae bacterium]
MTMGSVEISDEGPLSAAAVAPAASAAEGFWAGYWKTLKPLAVEEPVDVWIHRPLAYVLAKVLYPTPVSPNLVTMISIVFGLLGAYCFLSGFPHHMLLGGLAIFTSAIFDCADGQLARMRGTSSAFGRMLDGVADLVVSVAAVGGGIFVIASKFHSPTPLLAAVLALCVATAVTGSFHTGMYDQYKNVYLRFTSPTFKEGEDYETARERFESNRGGSFWVNRIAWPIYLFYVKSQTNYVHKFDPHTSARLALFGPFDLGRAQIYERHCGSLMRLWRTWFGFGSLVFGIALFSAIDLLEVYMVFRLVALNLVFYGYMRPRQRAASRAAFAEMGLELPDHAKA